MANSKENKEFIMKAPFEGTFVLEGFEEKMGIGKFGVGGTLGGISGAKHIDAYSLKSGGDWMYTFFDVDEIRAGKGVPKPTQQDPPKEYSKNFL